MTRASFLLAVPLLAACQPSTMGLGASEQGDELGTTLSTDDDGSGSESGTTGDGDTESSSTGDGDAGTEESSSSTGDGDTSTESSSTGDGDTGTDTGLNTDIGPEAWLPGAPGLLIPAQELLTLPAAPSGPPIWVSNNPESFTGNGWLVLHSRADPQRGGAADPIEGNVPAYLFHVNGSGGGKWVHLVATNPQPDPVTISAVGSIYDNGQEPLAGPGTGPSYRVAEDWLSGTPAITVPDTQLAANGGAAVLASRPLAAGEMIDGRFELTASAGVYLYAVVTNSSATNPAINATQGPPAPGTLAMPGPNAYGREAGLYEHGEFTTSFSAELPMGAGHLGFCFNTDAKFAWQGEFLQEQTAAARTILDDSAARSYGNYGHHFEVEIELFNGAAVDRSVHLALASLFLNDIDVPSFTWSAPVRVGPAGQEQIVETWTTPTEPVDELGAWMVPAGDSVVFRVEAYIPGLISAGQQLQVWVE